MKRRLNFIFLIGRPGSGKDTQVKALLKELPQAIAISPGEIFRKGQNPEDSEFGRFHSVVKPHETALNNGSYIPAEAISAVIKDSVNSAIKEGRDTFIINGHPRGVSQLEAINGFIQNLGQEYETKHLYMYLAVPQGEAENRMAARQGGESLEAGFPRFDDEAKVAKKRLEVFQNETLPMLKKLLSESSKATKDKDSFAIIRGEGAADNVHQRISTEVKSFLNLP